MNLQKKLPVLLLALTMILSLAVTAFAAEGDPVYVRGDDPSVKGTITIKNAIQREEYRIYQVLYLESYSITATGTHYAYKAATDAWETFFRDVKTNDAAKKNYFTVDSNGYVIWNKGVPESDANKADLAKKALAYAKAQAIQADAVKVAGADPVSFTDLTLGYYLVDTSLGTLCSLDTTDNAVEMEEKNKVPVNVKSVKEDSDGWGSENHADIGQTVEFKSEITVYPGTSNLTFHDTMGANFVKTGNVTVKRQFKGSEETALTAGYTLEEDKAHTAADGDINTGTCTFDIKFEDSVFEKNGTPTECKITIMYSAILQDTATIGVAGTDNTNTSRVTYGEFNHATPESKTVTRTFAFPVKKVDKGTNQPLDNTTFQLCANHNGSAGDPISLVKITDGTDASPQDVYRVAKADETGVTDIVTNAFGQFKIQGLDADIYFLKETRAKEGYHMLEKPVKVQIVYTPGENGAAGTAEIKQETTDGTGAVSMEVTDIVKIENGSGTRLPSTGGIGTTVFYVLGGILTVGAVILLVTKKRMNAEQ